MLLYSFRESGLRRKYSKKYNLQARNIIAFRTVPSEDHIYFFVAQISIFTQRQQQRKLAAFTNMC